MEDAELLEIKDRAWERFSELPGVHAVGIGKKVTRGVRTDETVLAVFVTRKLPLEELSATAVVPAVFEGVKTDIVESPMPRTLQIAIGVAPPSITSGGSFTFTALPDPPPLGVRIVVTITLRRVGADDRVIVRNIDSDGALTLVALVNLLFIGLTATPVVPTLTNTTLRISVEDPASESLDASCYILLIDTGAYAKEFLRGGIRIQGGSAGTLGCLAVLKKRTVESPNGRIVGVTCSHVVRKFRAQNTGLVGVAEGTTVELHAPPGAGPILAHSVVTVGFLRKDVGVEASAFYTTQQDEPLATIAAGVVTQIKATGLSGVSPAIASAPLSPVETHIIITGFKGPGEELRCQVHGPMNFPGPLQLRAEVAPGPLGVHTVTFRGVIDGPHIGVFVDIDPGGFAATFGVYHNPVQTKGVEDVAQAISTAINNFSADHGGLVSAGAVGAKVTIAGAKDVRIWLEPDIRVGQPVSFFGTANPGCCNFRIGRVLQSRLDIDVALVQLDAGLKYKYHVQELNAIAGTQAPVLNMPVQKRGAATGLTEGIVQAVATSGFITEPTLVRIYRNAAVIDSTILDTSTTRRAFAGPGDSGCVVVTRGPGLPKVVGVLFAGSDSTAVITPVDDVVSAFSSLGLSFDPGVGVDLNAVHIVPQSASQFRALEADDTRLANGTSLVRPFAALNERMRQAEHEIASTPMGREYADLVRRNIDEAFALVNHNRRVATAWHRSGGPELLTALLRVMRFDDEPLPHDINGRPLSECLAGVEKAFRRCASPQLSGDVTRLFAELGRLSGLTYPQVLATLRAGSAV